MKFPTRLEFGTGPKVTGGDDGFAVSLSAYATAEAGDGGVAYCSPRGDSIAGAQGLAIASHEGTVEAGEGGILAAVYADESNRLRLAVAYPGENGILPFTQYTVNRKGEFIAVRNREYMIIG